MRPNRLNIRLAVVGLVVAAAFVLFSQPAMAKKRALPSPDLMSQTVELPAGDDVFPDRPGAETADRNCLSCHSVDMVLNQPALPRETWAGEIEKMQTVFKAAVDPGDIEAILDYLTAIRGESRRSWR